mgnify:CR=1 FL=1
MLGPVGDVNVDGTTVEVLGQRVRLTPATVLDGLPGGVTALSLGDVVEVHGFFDAGAMMANYVATRIERRASAPAAYRVRGLVRELDATARTLRVGMQQFDLAEARIGRVRNNMVVVTAVVWLIAGVAGAAGYWRLTSRV